MCLKPGFDPFPGTSHRRRLSILLPLYKKAFTKSENHDNLPENS